MPSASSTAATALLGEAGAWALGRVVPAAMYLAHGGELLWVSERVRELIGLPAEDLVAEPCRWLQHVHPDDRLIAPHSWRPPPDDGTTATSDYRMIDATGRTLLVRDVRTTVCDDGRRLTLGVLTPVRAGAGATDALTGLPDRELLAEHLRLVLGPARRARRRVALVLVGVDETGLVNRTLGRGAGDAVLRTAGDRLARVAEGAGALLSRFDGDVFALLLPDLMGDPMAVVEAVAGEALMAVREPIFAGGRVLALGATAGVSVFGDDAHGRDDLLAHAEAALQDAKRSTRGGLAVYAGGTTQALERLLLITRLRAALERDELRVHYQPIFALPEGRIAAMEALVRWEDPHRGTVLPAAFVPVAEVTGLIEPIGRRVLELAARDAAAWPGDVPVTVNVSARQLRDARLVDHLAATLRETGLPGSALILELTESTAMQDPDLVEPVLAALRDLGVRLAIDDFGTGWSSLGRLHQLAADLLKLDRTLLPADGADAPATHLAAAAVGIGRSLGIRAVAEGIETDAQRTWALEHEVDFGQGFGLGRPMPAVDAAALLGA